MYPSHIIIGNSVVTTALNNEGIRVTPIRALKKFGMKKLALKSFPRLTLGSRKMDHTLLSMILSDDGMTYQQLLDNFGVSFEKVFNHLNN